MGSSKNCLTESYKEEYQYEQEFFKQEYIKNNSSTGNRFKFQQQQINNKKNNNYNNSSVMQNESCNVVYDQREGERSIQKAHISQMKVKKNSNNSSILKNLSFLGIFTEVGIGSNNSNKN